MYYIILNYLLYDLAIHQVIGIELSCQPVGLINQCIVMWNVSLCMYNNQIKRINFKNRAEI